MMSTAVKRHALLALVVAGAISVAIAGISATAARASGGTGPYWGIAAALTPAPLSAGLLDTATCTSSGTCLVGGNSITGSSTGVPAVVAESGGTWGAPSTTTVTGAPSNDGGYTSISCMSASACFGVGYNSVGSVVAPFTDAIAVSGADVKAAPATTLSLPSTPASSSPEVSGLASVSCTANGCTAVGSYKTGGSIEEPLVASTSGSGSWDVATVTPPSAATGGANLTAVSCASSGACEAVGNYKDSSNDVLSWSVQLAGTETARLLTAPAGAVPETGALPPTFEPINLSGGQTMNAISCPDAGGACTAVGTYPTGSGSSIDPMAFSINNGMPATGTALPPASGLALTSIMGLWCSDAGDCTADGDILTAGGSGFVFTPMSGYETSGTWSTFTDLPGAAPTSSSSSYVLGLGCLDLDTCLAAGLQGNAALTSYEPMVDFSQAPLSVTTSALPGAVVGVPYSATLQSAGGAGASTWSINNGSLPAGLSLDTSTGVISGTPTAPSASSFTARLTSAGPPLQAASTNLSITVAAAPVPAPPAAPAAPKLSSGPAKVTPNGVTLSLGCSGSGTCSGKAVVTAMEHLTGRRITAVTARAKKRKVTITLARGSYSLTAGQLGTINLKLTAQAKVLLRKLHTIKGRLTLTPTGASKPTLTRTVTFKQATKKK